MELKQVYEILGRTYAQMIINSEREDMWYNAYQGAIKERDELRKEIYELKNGMGLENSTKEGF